MNRLSKLVVIASNLTAVWLVATLVSRGLPSIFLPTVFAFCGSSIAAVVFGDVVASLVLSTVYLVPAACFAWFGNFAFSHYAIWLAGMSGSMLPRALGSRWAFPTRFTIPLVLWALVLALSWPILVWREVDFVPALLSPAGMAASRLPESPAIIAVWIACVTAIGLTGLLLLDWMCLTYSAARSSRFESRVATPLLAGAVVAAMVASYQSLVDISFLNRTLFGSIGRAVGTMRDANAFGAMAALWWPVAVAKMIGAGRRIRTVAWSVIAVFLGIGVWASGSRTALLAACIGLFVVVFRASRVIPVRRLMVGGVIAVLVCAALGRVVPSTAWGRAKGMVPTLSRQDLTAAAYQLWSRDLYGTTALAMVAEHPLVGVGVGGFNYLYGDVMFRISGAGRPPDNAQNWYRQQLAELGLIGSLGWMTWLGMFIWMLARRPDVEGTRAMAGAAQGAILGLAAASLLGMPTQDTAASITFVVMLYWCLQLKGYAAPNHADPVRRPSRSEWVGVCVIVAGFLGGTVRAAQTELRPAFRAFRGGYPYSHGFASDPHDPGVRWAGARAVEVFSAEKRWLKIVIADVAPDAALDPVEVDVRINRQPILSVRRRANFPITRWIRMPAYGTPLIIEIDVDRTWRPLEAGHDAEPARGVAIREWSFSQEDPPRGSMTVESPPPPL
jgi:O-Antigen ligase